MAGEIIGKVQSIQSFVQLRGQGGEFRTLTVGDELLEGDTIVTGAGSMVMTLETGGSVLIGSGQTSVINLDLSSELFAGAEDASIASLGPLAAAVLGDGDLGYEIGSTTGGNIFAVGDEGSSFTQLLRIVERVDPASGLSTTDFETPIIIDDLSNDAEMLASSEGSDAFVWELSDRGAGTEASPTGETIPEINMMSLKAAGDTLDLRDLLQGEDASDMSSLDDFLHFTVSGGNTTVEISSKGGFSGGYDSAVVDQRIELSGVDLTSGGSLADQQIIQNLLNNGKLITD